MSVKQHNPLSLEEPHKGKTNKIQRSTGRDAFHTLPISVKPNGAWPQVERCYGGPFVLFSFWQTSFSFPLCNFTCELLNLPWQLFVEVGVRGWGAPGTRNKMVCPAWGGIGAEGSTPCTDQHGKQRQQKFISHWKTNSGYQKHQLYFGQNCFCGFGGSAPYHRMHSNSSTWGCQPCKSYNVSSCLPG